MRNLAFFLALVSLPVGCGGKGPVAQPTEPEIDWPDAGVSEAPEAAPPALEAAPRPVPQTVQPAPEAPPQPPSETP
jgi:hypothetical protein